MRVLKWLLLSVLLVLVAATALGAWLLATQQGRNVLMARVNAMTGQLAMPVELGRLEGRPWRDARLGYLQVADAGGAWLRLQDIRLLWRPLALLRGQAPFEMLEIGRVQVVRLPELLDQPAQGDEQAPVDVVGYLRWVPREIRLPDVLIEAAVAGARQRLQGSMTGVGQTRALTVATLEGPVTQVSGTLLVEAADAGALEMALREAPQGVLGGMMRLPRTDGIDATMAVSLRDNVLEVTRFDASFGQSRVEAVGRGQRDGQDVRASIRVAVPQLRAWQGWLGEDITGAVYAAAEVSGSLMSQEGVGVSVVASRTDVSYDTYSLSGVQGRMNGRVAARDGGRMLEMMLDGGGTLRGVGKGAYPLTLVGRVSGTEGIDDGRWEGDVNLGMVRAGERAQVRVAGAGGVSPLTVVGDVSGSWVQGRQVFRFASGLEMTPTRLGAERMMVTGPGTAVSGSLAVDLVSLTAVGRGAVRVDDLRPLAALAGADAQGEMNAGWALDVRSGVQMVNVRLDTLAVRYAGQEIELRQPARLEWDGVRGVVSPLMLEVAGGTVLVQGTVAQERVSATLVAQGIEVARLTGDDTVSGRLGMQLKMSGLSSAPVVVANGTLRGEMGERPLDVSLQGNWRQNQLAVTGEIQADALRGKVDIRVAGGLGLVPFRLGIDAESALRGRVDVNMDLSRLNPLLWASRQQVAGQLQGDLSLGGRLGAPDVGGKVTLRNGEYSHSTTGVCLRNVEADLIGNRDQIVLERLAARDDTGGELNGRGRVGLSGNMALAAEVMVQRLRIFCGGPVLGTVDGNIALNGTLPLHTVSGRLLVGPLTVQVPGASGAADIPQVETIRVRANERAEQAPMTTARLQVELEAPREIYVRGRGLDAEFGGAISVRGTTDAPLLNGSLKALRGQFTLLDRTLQLQNTSVRFEGAVPPSPYLDVNAVSRVQGTEITLHVGGSALKPSIDLRSEPSLPQDELLAMLLFGRTLENISAFQALKLAQATRVLAGLDSGEPGLLDKARDTLGVDTLEVGSGDEGGGVTVTTGKYLTDDIYLSLEQGAEPEDRKVKTELELLPNVTGHTTVDGAGGQSFGLEWRRDY